MMGDKKSNLQVSINKVVVVTLAVVFALQKILA